MLGQELGRPIVKSDQPLRLWCLAEKGYTALETNPISAKQAWQEAQMIAHRLGENQWEARAKGELGILAFLEGDSRRAATLVAGPTFVEAPKTIRWATRWEGTPVPGSPDRRRQISQNNPTLLRIG